MWSTRTMFVRPSGSLVQLWRKGAHSTWRITPRSFSLTCAHTHTTGAHTSTHLTRACPKQLNQGKVAEALGSIFGISTGFLGTLISKLAKLKLDAVATEANDKHAPGFQRVCAEHNVNNTAISPIIDKELLKQNHLSVDGSAIEKACDFEYKQPFSGEGLRQVVELAIQDKFFPPILAD
jgi:hypothetical protein